MSRQLAGRWQDSARCATTDPDLFMPENVEQRRIALGICQRCTVLDECLAWAMTLDERHGVIGGRDWDTTDRFGLYNRGLTDREIATIEVVNPNTIAMWRHARSLPPNGDPTIRGVKEVTRRRLGWHARGWTDQQMAGEDKVSPQSIQKWRERQGLARNQPAPSGFRVRHMKHVAVP